MTDAIRNHGSHEPCAHRRIEPIDQDALSFKLKMPPLLIALVMETRPQGASFHDTVLSLLYEAVRMRIRAATLE